MSTINEALKRVARGSSVTAAGGRLPGGGDERFPEALPRGVRSVAREAGGIAGPAVCLAKVPPGHFAAGKWGLLAAAPLLAAAFYAAFALRGQPTVVPVDVYRERIVDDRPSLLAENKLPEENLGSNDLPGDAAVSSERPAPIDSGGAEGVRPTGPGTSGLKEPAAFPRFIPPRPMGPSGRTAYGQNPARGGMPAPGARPDPAVPGARPYTVLPVARPPYYPPAGFNPAAGPNPMAARMPGPVARSAGINDELLRRAAEKEQQGQPEQAVVYYAMALEKAPGDEGISLRLSNLHYGRQRYDEAEKVLTQAVAVKETAVLHNNLGSVYLAQGKMDVAKEQFTAAVGLNGSYAEPHYNLACYYAKTGQHEEGLAELRKAKDLNSHVVEWAAEDGDLADLRALPGYKRLTE
ncbi:MAG: tetratricopeptide repeat protein [Pseudomonadota bacterium]